MKLICIKISISFIS